MYPLHVLSFLAVFSETRQCTKRSTCEECVSTNNCVWDSNDESCEIDHWWSWGKIAGEFIMVNVISRLVQMNSQTLS